MYTHSSTYNQRSSLLNHRWNRPESRASSSWQTIRNSVGVYEGASRKNTSSSLRIEDSLSRFVEPSLERRRPRKEETKERNEGKVEKRRRRRGLIRGWEACRLVVKPGLITATNYPAVIRTLSGTLSTFCPGDGTSPPAIIRITRRTLEPLKSREREREEKLCYKP